MENRESREGARRECPTIFTKFVVRRSDQITCYKLKIYKLRMLERCKLHTAQEKEFRNNISKKVKGIYAK